MRKVLVIGEAIVRNDNSDLVSGGGIRSTVFLSKVSKYFDKVYYVPSILGNLKRVPRFRECYIEDIYRFSAANDLEIPFDLYSILNLNYKYFFDIRLIQYIKSKLNDNYDLIYVTSEAPTDLNLAIQIKSRLRGFIIHGSWINGRYLDEIKYILDTHSCVNPLYSVNKLSEKLLLNVLFRKIFSSNKLHFAIYINTNSLTKYSLFKYNIITKRLFPGIAINFNENYNISRNKEGIISISTAFTPFKGLCRLVKFLKILGQNNDEIKLTLIGELPRLAQKQIFNVIKNNNKMKIKTLGKLSHEEVLKNLRSSKLNINFSFTETYSFVNLESIANYTPVISFYNGTEEIYKNIKPVIFVHNEQELFRTIKVYYDKDLDYLFDETVKDFLKKHSNWDEIIQNEIKIIKSFFP
ncbi:glycosyltransferase [Saccharolobus islandicus]|uniref:glycosyltransferase n=1 Tax=Saccharolobus islandicus TaxID=43080 RepID=UPI000362C784|nr:glycosyltransferase [Sulfolobus islandicus]